MNHLSLNSPQKLMRFLRFGWLMAVLLGSQASHSQTAEETLFSIREIYNNQADCNLGSMYTSGFRFLYSYNEDKAELMFLYSAGVRGRAGREPPDEFFINFDLRRIASIRPLDRDGDFPKLVFECRGREGCVYFSGWGQNSSSWFAVFCSREARARVGNALRHLQSITPALPALKF